MKNSSKSYHHLISLLFGLVASVGTMYLWILLFLDSSISVLTSILLLLPAIIGLMTSFVRPPLIIISFVISFPFSTYLKREHVQVVYNSLSLFPDFRNSEMEVILERVEELSWSRKKEKKA